MVLEQKRARERTPIRFNTVAGENWIQMRQDRKNMTAVRRDNTSR